MYNILIITNSIPPYRDYLYEKLGKLCQLTVAHFGVQTSSKIYDEITLSIKKIGSFILIDQKIAYQNYDVVIVWSSLRFVEFYKLALMPNRKFKVIAWGPGVSSSYSKKYDKDKKVAFIYKLLFQSVDAALFYDNYPVIKYSAGGLNPNKLFAAPNTVYAEENKLSKRIDRNSLLFIGTLYKEKGVIMLLEAFRNLINSYEGTLMLDVIGDGPELGSLKMWVERNGIKNKVNFHGKITNEKELKPYFQNAIACVSPFQAGLSVIKSLAYGVPFVTTKFPITGGEYTSIIEGVTGFYFDGSVENLEKTLVDIIRDVNIDKCYENCWIYYKHFRSPENWVNQIISSIEFVMRS